MRTPARILAVLFLCLALLPLGVAAGASHAAFAPGDVFVGVGSSTVQWRHADGAVTGLSTPGSSPTTSGMAFDDAGRLYVAGYTSNVVNRLQPTGGGDIFLADLGAHPESVAFDLAGNLFVGLETGSRDLLKVAPSGAILAAYDTATERKGTDRLDVATDNCTVLYTSQAASVKRFDTCADAQLPDLNAAPLPGSEAHDVRALPDGGALVADTQAIHRLDASGGIAATYDAPGRDCWTTLSLAPDFGSFLAGDRCATRVHRFDLSTGGGEELFDTGTKAGSLNGLAQFPEGRAARHQPADLAVTQVDSPDPVTSDNEVLYRVTVSNAGPNAAAPTLAESVSAGTIRLIGAPDGWSCSAAGGATATCSGGPLGAGDSAVVDFVVHAPTTAEPATITSTATVSSSQADPAPGNNDSTESTAVQPDGGDSAVSYIPPQGGRVSTRPSGGVTEANHTFGEAIFGTGPGGIAAIAEGAQLSICIVSNCAGASVDVIVPDGYDDPSDPIRVVVGYHASVAPASEGDRLVWVEEPGPGGIGTIITPLLPCAITGRPKCVEAQERDADGNLEITILMLSQDPRFQG